MPTRFDPASIARYADVYGRELPIEPTSAATAAKADTPNWPYWLLWAGQGADIGSTLAATRNPNLREGNPMGVPGVIAAKLGAAAGLTYLMHRAAEKGDTKAMKTIGTIGGLMGLGPAAWNTAQMVK